jgi:acetyl esterase
MAVDPQVQAILDLLARTNPGDLSTLDVAAARKLREERRLPPGPDAQVDDHSMAGPGGPLKVRRYRPPDARGKLGALVYFHGGGFVLGSIEGHDALCRQLAVSAGCAVLSVEYRLAPEHKFPAAVDDASTATAWVHANASRLDVDPARIAIGGDSAGATLATVAAVLAKRNGGQPLILQVLLYPVTDLRTLDTPSYLENASGYFLTRSAMGWFRDHYLSSEAERANPLASPLAAQDLSGLPPALVITAEYDPLRDEGEAYARALQAAGVRVTVHRYAGMIHGFVSMYAFVDAGRVAVTQVTDALRAALG